MNIPVPVEKIDTLEDKRHQYTQAWLALFNAIDSRNIKAYAHGSPEFPEYSFHDTEKVNPSVHYLDDGYKIAIFLVLKGKHLEDVGSQAYCCEENVAFGDSSHFIDDEENPPYAITERILAWNKLYHLLIDLTNAYRRSIPAPPKEPLY
jgi:hypothetical protein